MVRDSVEVNGATMERGFFQDNLAEANACYWTSDVVAADHQHCTICSAAIGRGVAAFNAGHRWLCGSCHERFLVKRDTP